MTRRARSITITYVPAAADDSDLGNAFGTDVNVDVLANDTGDFAAGGVRLHRRCAARSRCLVVPGEGTWTVQLDDTITFSPDSGFLTDPTAIAVPGHRHHRRHGRRPSITVTYLPLAVDDPRGGLVIGSRHHVPVLSNDNGDFSIPSLRLSNPVTGTPTAGPVTVAGQGVWSLGRGAWSSPRCPAFLVDPDPIDVPRSPTPPVTPPARQITLDYVPGGRRRLRPRQHASATIVDVDVLDNDTGASTIGSLGFARRRHDARRSPRARAPGPCSAGGVIRFAPDARFLGDPAPVDYLVTDVTGDTVDGAGHRSPTCPPRPTTPISATPWAPT